MSFLLDGKPLQPVTTLTSQSRWLLRLLDTDSISYEVYGFWGCAWRRLRDFVPYFIQRFWERRVRTIYAPQHSRLRAAIPKTWCDLDGCIESFLFACVIDFVEGEEGLKDWESQNELMGAPWPADAINPRRQQAAMLREVYEWAKSGRQAAEDAMFAAAPGYDAFVKGASYDEMNRLSNEMEAKTERYVRWIVEYRGYMWT